MQTLLILRLDNQQFAGAAIEAVIKAHSGFRDLRYQEPGGAILETEYSIGIDSTIVGLNSDRKTISISGVSDAALQVVLFMQQALQVPLRLIDADYSFDLALRGFANVAELRRAIDFSELG